MSTVEDTHPLVVKHSSQRFVTLDAMRGVAAIAVILFHYGANTGGGGPRFGYLAVDAFFLISGFVLAFRYDRDFAAGLKPLPFMWARALRLAPVYFLGLALSVAVGLWLHPRGLSSGQVSLSGLIGLLGLPSPPMAQSAVLFPLNVPFWSLFFEYWVANLVLAFGWRYLKGRTLAGLIIVSAIALIANERLYYTFDVGPRWIGVFGGIARVLFSFFLGVGLLRLHLSKGAAFHLPSFILLTVFCLCFLAPLEARAAHLFELLAVLAIFPAVVFLGASATERNPRIGQLLGEASYAAYAIHIPLLYTVLRLAYGPAPAGGYAIPGAFKWIGALAFAGFVGVLAWTVDATYDKRLRKLLRSLGSS